MKLSSFYPEAVDLLYSRDPSLSQQPAQAQADAMLGFSFSWADHPTRELIKLGVEAQDLIWGVSPYYDKLRSETGIQGPPFELAVSRMKEFNPDIVLFQDPFIFDAGTLDEIKRRLPGVKGWIAYKCSPYSASDVETLKRFNLLLSCTPGFVTEFRRRGMSAELVRHAFPARILEQIPAIDFQVRSIEFAFTGSIIRRPQFHNDRLQLLEALLRDGADLRLYASRGWQGPGLKNSIKRGVAGFYGIAAPVLPEYLLVNRFFEKARSFYESKLPRIILDKMLPPQFGLDMFRTLGDTQICLNIHGEVTGPYAGNVRLFEATGMGSCLLTDSKVNLKDMFEPDYEVVTYKTFEECHSKARWLVENKADAARIAARGQQRCLREHTFENFAQQLKGIVLREFLL